MGETIAIKESQPTSSLASLSSGNDISLNTKLALRPYQSESLEQVEKAYKNGSNRLLVSLPTGTGKTVIFSHLVARNEGRSLIIAHRDELIEQAASKIRMVLPTADVGIVKAERNQASSQIVVASVQTLARESRLLQVGKFDTIIIDEAHHAAADSYVKVLKSLGCFDKDNPPLTLGVTATPERGDKVGLDSVFQEIVYHRDLLDMISEQYLSDLTWKKVDLGVDLDEVSTRGGDFVEADLIKALTDKNLPEKILSAFQQYASDRKTIVFVPGVALARETAKLFQEHNIKCESIDGKLPPEDRKGILSRLSTGETQVVVNCLILTEGFDEPTIQCVIFARPTKSKSFYLQMLGRGTRLHPGKTECLVIDLVGVTQKHKLITLPNLFGFSPDKLKKKSILAIQQEEINEEAKRQALAQQEAENQAKASDSSTKSTTPELSRKEPRVINFNWLKLSESRYALSVGKGILFLIKQANTQEKWAVILNEVDKTKTLIAKDLPLEYAQGVAQDYVRSIRAIALIDSNASWRSQEPTDKQISLLEKLGIEVNCDTTKGQASDLITIFFANQDLSDSSLEKFITDQTVENETISCKPETIQNNQDSKGINSNNTSNNNTYNAKEEKITTLLEKENNTSNNTPKPEPSKTFTYKPSFAKICLAQNIEQLKLYDTYTLDNYIDKGQLGYRGNKTQLNALLTIRDYAQGYVEQEIGVILASKGSVGKTHLAIGLLRHLTTNYDIATFFCDSEAIAKRANKIGYTKTLDEVINLIDKSEAILLDNLTLRSDDINKKKFFLQIIHNCYKDDKKLVITTKHLSYSSSPFACNNHHNEDPAIFLSLGDALGIKEATNLYEKCAYLEITANKAEPMIPTNLNPVMPPSQKSDDKPTTNKTEPTRSNSGFSSMGDILNSFYSHLRKKS
jgi:superfamily II DNA or RNA helicase/DNA replication protein DnaC